MRKHSPERTHSRSEDNQDLGFGAVVSSESRARLLNPDGTFNVSRGGLNFWTSLRLYDVMLTVPWSRFLGLLLSLYVLTNLLFATAYVLCGPGAITGLEGSSMADFAKAFFFSVHTFSTIGYGNVSPVSLAANVVVTVEALVGLLGVALSTGIIFARFSRPTAKVIFSNRAVVAPHRGKTAFMFRMTNARISQLLELEATVLLARFEESNGRRTRRFYPLALERPRVVLFPLSWTVVHYIDDASPLWRLNGKDLESSNTEVLVLLRGTDEPSSQVVYARTSYKATDITWGARFGDMYQRSADGLLLTIDVRRLHDVEIVELPEADVEAES